MTRTILAAAAATLLSGTAMAADLGRPITKAPPAPLPSYYNWTGFYAGVNIGGAFGRVKANTVFGDQSTSLDGVAGGGQIGYNWQFNNVVFGIETDFQGSSQSKTVTDPFFGISETARIGYFGTVRGRLGLAWDRSLAYVTGGYAYQNVKLELADALGSVSTSSTRSGWTIGGGFEYAFAGPWTAGLEYLYIDTGRRDFVIDGFNVASVKTTNNIVRANLNYRF